MSTLIMTLNLLGCLFGQGDRAEQPTSSSSPPSRLALQKATNSVEQQLTHVYNTVWPVSDIHFLYGVLVI